MTGTPSWNQALCPYLLITTTRSSQSSGIQYSYVEYVGIYGGYIHGSGPLCKKQHVFPIPGRASVMSTVQIMWMLEAQVLSFITDTASLMDRQLFSNRTHDETSSNRFWVMWKRILNLLRRSLPAQPRVYPTTVFLNSKHTGEYLDAWFLSVPGICRLAEIPDTALSILRDKFLAIVKSVWLFTAGRCRGMWWLILSTCWEARVPDVSRYAKWFRNLYFKLYKAYFYKMAWSVYIYPNR